MITLPASPAIGDQILVPDAPIVTQGRVVRVTCIVKVVRGFTGILGLVKGTQLYTATVEWPKAFSGYELLIQVHSGGATGDFHVII